MDLAVGRTAAAAAGWAARRPPPSDSSWRRVLTAAVSLRHRTVAPWHWALSPLDMALVQIPTAPSVLQGCGASAPLWRAPEPLIGPWAPGPATVRPQLSCWPGRGRADAACRRAAAVLLCAGGGTAGCWRWGFFPLPELAPLMARALPRRVIILLKGGAVCMRRHRPSFC